jgi:thiamine kinase-like enzyme
MLKSLVSSRLNGWEDFSFQIGEKLIEGLHFFRRSKVGRLSWRAAIDGQPVKIYECHSESHAALVETVSANRSLQKHFPTWIMRFGKYVVAEWVQGEQLSAKQLVKDKGVLNQMAGLQALIHSQDSTQPFDDDSFKYMDYLKCRLQRYKGLIPIDDAIEKIYLVLEEAKLDEHRISHPDLTVSNLIVAEESGTLKIIDNELLSCNQYYLIDLLNTYYSLHRVIDQAQLISYLTCYVENGGNLRQLIDREEFFHALWYLRFIGSSLQAGDVGKAFHIAHRYAAGDIEEHILIKLAKERFV